MSSDNLRHASVKPSNVGSVPPLGTYGLGRAVRRTATVLAGVALALSSALVAPTIAHADAPAASASAAPTPSPRERLSGRFLFVGGEKQVAAKDAAIEKATEDMSFAFRGFARSRLREVTAVAGGVSIVFKDGNVTVTAGGEPPTTSPDSGASVPHTKRDGKKAQLTQKLVGEALVQTVSTEDGSRTVTYAASADGRLLTVTHAMNSPKLPAPVRYTLTYRRG